MRMKLPLFLFMPFFFVSFVAASQIALAAASNGWIQERFDDSKGHFTIYVTANAVCSRNEDAGYAVVQAVADPTLYIYSDRRRNYYPLSAGTELKRTSSFMLMKAIATSINPLDWHLAYKTSFRGHPTEVWRATKNGSPIKKSESDRFDGYEFWAASDIPIQPGFVKLSRDANGWPETKGLPVRYARIFLTEKPRELLATMELKRAYIPPSTFLVPKAYKKA